MDIQQKAIKSVVWLINDKTFQYRYKKNPKDFSRERKLSFATIASMLLRMVKKSIQIECIFTGDLMGMEAASKQAFSQARNKILPEAFEAILEDGIRVYYSEAPKRGLWKDHRIIACDGSTLRLHSSEDLEAEFGRYVGKGECENYPVMARISEFTDMATKLVLSGRIEAYNVSEDKLAEEQLEELVPRMRGLKQSKLLFVYDRGYPSERFIDQHVRLEVDFLFRLPKDFNKATSEICKWEDSEGYIVREGWPLLRLVKVPLSSGETELLLTSLRGEEYTHQDMSEVYQGRWTSMEEGYKKQKIMMQLENFSGRTVTAIRQEYLATLVVANILEMGCTEIEGCWVPGNLPKKHINRSVLFGSMRDATMEVILGMMPIEDYQRRANEISRRFMIKLRPGRSYSRAGVGKPKRHHIFRRAC